MQLRARADRGGAGLARGHRGAARRTGQSGATDLLRGRAGFQGGIRLQDDAATHAWLVEESRRRQFPLSSGRRMPYDGHPQRRFSQPDDEGESGFSLLHGRQRVGAVAPSRGASRETHGSCANYRINENFRLFATLQQFDLVNADARKQSHKPNCRDLTVFMFGVTVGF